MDRAVEAEAGAARPGLLQSVDPRVKLVGLLSLVAAVALSHRLEVIAALLVFGLALCRRCRSCACLALVSGRLADGGRVSRWRWPCPPSS